MQKEEERRQERHDVRDKARQGKEGVLDNETSDPIAVPRRKVDSDGTSNRLAIKDDLRPFESRMREDVIQRSLRIKSQSCLVRTIVCRQGKIRTEKEREERTLDRVK